MKKYNLLIAGFNGIAIYLILHYGGTSKWIILSLFTGSELLLWYFFVRNKKNHN